MYRFELSQFSGFHEHCSCAQVPTLSSTGWQGAWHELKTALQRFGDPDSAIASEGALRVYGITPCAGPETGGTKVTIQGQYFSKYCDLSTDGFCNSFQCNFFFSYGGSPILRAVDASYISDKVLTCVTPPAIKGKATKVAKVQIAVDLNPACSTDVDDATNQYNQVDFVYQTTGTDYEIPGPEIPVNQTPTTAPHRLEGPWDACFFDGVEYSEKNITAVALSSKCTGWPGMSPSHIDRLGYISCLPGFNSVPRQDTAYPGNPTDARYPVWCIRALPLNAMANYQFTIVDPFFETIAFLHRVCPQNHPGFCHRTEHERPWGRFSRDLDYRRFDFFDRSYFKGATLPEPISKETQGRNLIDRVWSTTAAQRIFPYMRAFLHEIGEAYGFIALGIALNIDIDFTLATSFDLTRMRRTKSCAKASPRATRSSGEAGDTGPAGTYVNWNQHDWKPGKPSCANDARYTISLHPRVNRQSWLSNSFCFLSRKCNARCKITSEDTYPPESGMTRGFVSSRLPSRPTIQTTQAQC
jgi:hypothetical protein